MEDLLISRLQPVIRRHRWQVVRLQLAAAWSLGALICLGFILAQAQTGWTSRLTAPVLAGLASGVAVALILRHHARPADYRFIAQKIEQRHPELQGLLLTAVQQQPMEGSSRGYLQHRLLGQAMEHSRASDWRDIIPRSRVFLSQGVQLAALGLFLFALSSVGELGRPGGAAWAPKWGVVVTPGDTSIERGESLVVLARFGGRLPAGVDMIVRTSGAVPQTIALVKSLADPVFGASVPDVNSDLVYHLEYAGKSTRDYKVTVFEHPRLERADATLTYPDYTRLTSKRIENTRRVSAVEGTRLDLALQLNKPVVSAALVARDAKKTVIPLQVTPDKAAASLPQFPLVASQTYDLRLVDSEGRGNPVATPFVIDVLPDRPPELHITSPRGDLRPSAVEEINFSGTMLGEFGVSAYGVAYTQAGEEAKVVELGRSVPAMEKQSYSYTLALENLGVQPDQLISWYVWADDIGPDGKPRRTTGDLYFAEIRPFDEIFRENKGMGSQGDQQGGGGESQRLIELQKQIIVATWKLQRNPTDTKYPDDAKVVHDSQAQALAQAAEGQQKSEDPRTKTLWTAVAEQMKQALNHLREAGKAPTALSPALTSEQAAYQSLMRLQSRETQVARGSRGGRGRGGASQRQLDQLDLTQDQNRYETQREATPIDNPEKREQLQVMNRLQELARRQQDVNDRLKELQTALQEARTDQQREDIRQQLKRLQNEQQQTLADVDELRQRMDQQQNQTSMSDQRRQLEQTRGDVQRAAEAAGQGEVADALAAGTRAQRQLQEMRDELHRQSSSQFADNLRDMRAEARQMADQEEDIAQKLDPLANGSQPKRLSDTAEGSGAVPELERQKQRMTDLVNQAKNVAQQAETSEPLLAEKLYDSLRKLGQDDSGTAKEFQQELLNNGMLTRNLYDRLNDTSAPEGTKSLDLTSALLKEGYLPQAGEAERRARAGIDELKKGVERAAESVIGDDAAALKLARSELDAATDELKREAAPTPGQGANGGQTSDKSNPSAAAQAQAKVGSTGNSPSADQGGQGSAAAANGGNERSAQSQAPSLASAAGAPSSSGAGNADPLALGNLMGGGGNRPAGTPGAPITGNGYGQWSDRLREIEEIVDAPDLRNAVAAARERARLLRQDYTRELKKPDWAVVQLEIVKPLLEVRDHISDELARRESKDSLTPIDRDPVPSRYADSVRKYYEQLGKDQ